MEATIEKNSYTYEKEKFNKVVNNTIDNILRYVTVNGYRVEGDLKHLNLDISKVSMTRMKKIQKYCYWINKKPSLKKINTFLGLLSRTFDVERVKVKISEKEEKIQKSRKEWIKARNESERLLALYKPEKGDFYKKKLSLMK
jgi:hypothetical protein